jgi:hypothetical protein
MGDVLAVVSSRPYVLLATNILSWFRLPGGL